MTCPRACRCRPWPTTWPGKRLLLVLDNCEHLLDACAVLAGTLLAACPDLHVLATSRQALGVAGEVRMVVPPMSLPAEADDTSVQSLLGCDSVWLLSERAAAASPGFTVDAANAGQVLLLCRKLDGIPLALELAAVRLASLSLEQLNEGLASELSILGAANRGAEARQQTLEATIGWSYGLLDEQERLLWARLSVFAGGFQEDAATEVCTDARIPAGRVPGLLGALVDKSILKRQLQGADPPRYWLLETMRQYGLDRLNEAGETDTTAKRHFDWICGLARLAGAWDGRQPETFARMASEHDNLWAALDFCSRQPGELAAAAEAVQHLMAFWACRGPFGDVRRRLTALAELAPEDSLPRARLLWVAAVMTASQNDYDAAAVLSAESLRIGIETKDVEVVAWSLLRDAMSRWADGDLAGSTRQLESALSLARLMRVEQAELDILNDLCATLRRGRGPGPCRRIRRTGLGHQQAPWRVVYARLPADLPGPGELAPGGKAPGRGAGPRCRGLQARDRRPAWPEYRARHPGLDGRRVRSACACGHSSGLRAARAR